MTGHLRVADEGDAPQELDRKDLLRDVAASARRAATLYEEGEAVRTIFITCARTAERHLREGPA